MGITVIEGAHLIDGTGRDPVDRAVLVIEDDRIKSAGPEGEVDIPTGEAVVIDAAGRTVLPGLADLHLTIAGLSQEERKSSDVWHQNITEKTIASSTISGVANGQRCLEAGVTTARVDSAGHHGIFALKEAFASSVVPGPRLFVPGRGICMTGGHGWEGGPIEADGADEVRKAARLQLKAGADWIKLLATGGASSRYERVDDVQMTLEEIKAGVEEAHKKGKFAFAHVTCAEGARLCIEAGVDSIEHGIKLEEDNLLAMKEKGIFLVPTLGTYRRLVEIGRTGQVPPHMYQKALQVVEMHSKSFRMAMEMGVKIAAGTDSGGAWYPAGQSLLNELEVMNQEGMSPMEALISATRRAAECLRMQDDLGTLEAGKFADLLIVEGDPLADISAIRNTWMVFKGGRCVHRSQSAERLGLAF